MRERQIREVIKTTSGNETYLNQLAQIRQDVAYGLRLDEGLGESSIATRALIVSLVSETILNASSILNVSPSRVTISYPWEEREERSREYMCEASYQDSTISYIPSFLYLVGLTFEKKHNKAATAALVETTAHEMYHRFQSIRFPTTYARDLIKDRFFRSKMLTDDLPFGQEWKSRSEKSARKFGKRYAKHYLHRHSF